MIEVLIFELCRSEIVMVSSAMEYDSKVTRNTCFYTVGKSANFFRPHWRIFWRTFVLHDKIRIPQKDTDEWMRSRSEYSMLLPHNAKATFRSVERNRRWLYGAIMSELACK